MTLYAIATLTFVWLLALTWTLYKTRSHYNRLIGSSRREKLEEAIEAFLINEKKLLLDNDIIKKQIQTTVQTSSSHFHKIGVVRFNPYGSREGAQQSVVVALLNEKDSGIVMNFIYTHDGMRVYVKKIIEGKGDSQQLSDEEKKAIEKST